MICDGGDGSNHVDENTDHPAEAGWQQDNLPDDLGRLNPSGDWCNSFPDSKPAQHSESVALC